MNNDLSFVCKVLFTKCSVSIGIIWLNDMIGIILIFFQRIKIVEVVLL